MGHKQKIQSTPPKAQPLQCLASLTLPFAICLVSSKHNARSDSCMQWETQDQVIHAKGSIQRQHPSCHLGPITASVTQAGWLSTPSLFLLKKCLFHSTAGNQVGSPPWNSYTHAALLTAEVQPCQHSWAEAFTLLNSANIYLKKSTWSPPHISLSPMTQNPPFLIWAGAYFTGKGLNTSEELPGRINGNHPTPMLQDLLHKETL